MVLGDRGKKKPPFNRMKLLKKSRLRDRQLFIATSYGKGGRQDKGHIMEESQG